VAINADLSMLPLLHIEDQMILLHIGTQFSQMFQKLSLRKFVIADNACVLWDVTSAIFRLGKNELAKDALNFYLSQLWICIEQKFCMMTTKWRFLHQPPQVHLKNLGKVFMCITRLHNFCINEGCVCIINSEDSLENEVDIFHLILVKLLLQEILCSRYHSSRVATEGQERPTFN